MPRYNLQTPVKRGQAWYCCHKKMARTADSAYVNSYKCEICGTQFMEAMLPFNYLEPLERLEQ